MRPSWAVTRYWPCRSRRRGFFSMT
jgi:hypothetical protein